MFKQDLSILSIPNILCGKRCKQRVNKVNRVYQIDLRLQLSVMLLKMLLTVLNTVRRAPSRLWSSRAKAS